MSAVVECDSTPGWDLPVLTSEFTRCDIAQAANTGFLLALAVAGLTLFLLAYMAFRGR